MSDSSHLTVEDLEIAGRFLHGKQWQSPLARDLEMDARTVRRWVAGDSGISARAARRITALVAKRLVLAFIDQLTSAQAILGRLPAWPRLSLPRDDYGWSSEFHTRASRHAARLVHEGTGIHVKLAPLSN